MISIGGVIIIIEFFQLLQTQNVSQATNSSTQIRNSRAVFKSNARPWPNGVIPYKIDDGEFHANELEELMYAIETWNRDTCVNFRPYKSGDTNWLRIAGRDQRCVTYYEGFVNVGEHIVNLARKNCRNFGVILHELGHVIGLAHEHKRFDRDKYIYINFDLIPQRSLSQFSKGIKENQKTYGTPYDIESIEHYGGKINFGSGNLLVITDIVGKKHLNDAIAKDLSFFDVKAVNEHYGCNRHCRSQNVNCPNPGFIDKNCVCQTLEEFAKYKCSNRLNDNICEMRKSRNECNENFNFMVLKCRKTCNFCRRVIYTNPETTQSNTETNDNINKRDCKDRSNDCKDWANLGHCSAHREVMTEYCKETCQFC